MFDAPRANRSTAIARARWMRAALAGAALAALLPVACKADPPGPIDLAEKRLQEAFEGTNVTLLLDMPATAQGVDITPDAEKPLDLPAYQARLKKAGIALKRGEVAMVTKVKVKSRLVEFQLGGGGYGTFADERAGGSSGGAVGKSTREKNLERDLKRERDAAKRRAMQEELDRLRRDRARDEREASAEARQAAALEKERIRDKALSGGSRFNIRYPDGVSNEALTPASLRSALAKYVDFGAVTAGDGGAGSRGLPDRDRGDTGEPRLRKGASPDDLEALFGPPVSTTRRTDGGWSVTVNRYRRGSQRLEATFIEGVLVRYTLSEE